MSADVVVVVGAVVEIVVVLVEVVEVEVDVLVVEVVLVVDVVVVDGGWVVNVDRSEIKSHIKLVQ